MNGSVLVFNAVCAASAGNISLVFQFCRIEGATPLTDLIRRDARRFKLPAKLMREMDRLCSLQHCIFCLREDDLLDYQLDDAAESPEESPIARLCEGASDGCEGHFLLQLAVSARLFECVNELLQPASCIDLVDFNVLRCALFITASTAGRYG
jgi:hypothetical protein